MNFRIDGVNRVVGGGELGGVLEMRVLIHSG